MVLETLMKLCMKGNSLPEKLEKWTKNGQKTGFF